MGLLSLFRRSSLEPAWTYAPGGVIWTLRPAPGGRIVGEERDPDARTARYFCLAASDGRVHWEHVKLPQDWWTGIDAVSGSVVLFHDFAKPDLPQYVHIHAIDLATGHHLWTNEDAAFWCARGDIVYGTTTSVENQALIALDARTGAIRPDVTTDEQEVALLRSAGWDDGLEEAVKLPGPMSAMLTPERQASIQKAIGRSPVVGEPEVIVAGDVTVVSTYQRMEQEGAAVFRQRMIVLDRSNNIVYDVQAHAAARAPLPDTFFVFNDMLMYIGNDRVLTGVRLSPGSGH